MRAPILVINAGSSSIKFSVFETAADRSLEAGVHGQVEGIGTSPRLKIADAQGRYAVEHGYCFSSLGRVPLEFRRPAKLVPTPRIGVFH